MSRLIAVILILAILSPLITIPVNINAQPINPGIIIRPGTYGLTILEPTNETVRIMSDGSITIVINKTLIPWLVTPGPGGTVFIRLSLLLEEDIVKPFYRGTFINASTHNIFHGIYGGLIDVSTNRTLYNINGEECGNVTVYDQIVVIWLRFDKIESLENVPYVIYDYNTGQYRVVYEFLYNRELRLVIWDPRIEQYAMSYNKLIVFRIIYECGDVELSVYYSPAVFNDTVSLIVSFEKMFSKIEDITNISLNVAEVDYINITMVNKYEPSEKYYIASILNGEPDYSGEPVFIPVDFYVVNTTTLNYTGIVNNYAPLAPDPTIMYLSTLYMFIVEFEHSIINETTNLTFRITVDSECASTKTTPFLRINASLEVYPINIVGNDYTNPGDMIFFIAHNVPFTHLNNIESVKSFNLSNILAISVDEFEELIYYPDGVIIGSLYLPEYPYGGLTYVTYLVFSDDKYIVDGVLTIKPYILTYVLTSTLAYAEDTDGYYIGRFIPGDSAAPGDYVVVEGHGFDLNLPIDAMLNNIGLIILDEYSEVDKGIVLILLKLINRTSYEPVPEVFGATLFIGTPGTPNNATIAFNTIRGEPFKKVLFNPDWFRNETGYYIKHSKIGDPYLYFTVKYFDPVLDTIINPVWPESTIVEIIGWNTDVFVFKLYNKFFDIVYNWLNISLINGYGLVNLQNYIIPLLPYGNYTLVEEPLASVGDRTVFTVYTSIDVDVDPCRGGLFNLTIVGGAANTTYYLTFSYETLFKGTDKPYTIVPWQGEFTIEVTTDEYGYGFYSTLISNIYTTNMVIDLTWYTLIYLNVNGTGSEIFWYKWIGKLTNITDTYSVELIDPNSDIDFETIFNVAVNYNVTVILVSVEYIPRPYFTISVPEVVLPGDDIVVQIFPHRDMVYDLFIEPYWLFEETEVVWGWYVYARLVDPLTNNVIDEFEGYNVARIVEDVDGDGVGEIWFVVSLKAPLTLGVDKTYRVDVKLFLAVIEPYSEITGVNVDDQGCWIYLDLNGTVYWRGLSSGLMIGGDHQLVTVLGLLYGSIIDIKDGLVYINTTLNNLTRLISIDVLQLLRAINDTTVLIRNDTIEIRSTLGRLETKIDNLIQLVTNIDNNVTLILTCCKDVKNILERVETTLNNTYLIVMRIDGNLSNLLNIVNNELLPKFAELYRNISVLINATGEYIVENITAEMRELNRTVSILINTLRQDISNMISSAVNTILYRIGEINASIIYFINKSTERIIGSVERAVDDIIYKITLEINWLRENLIGLINARIDELKLFINDNITTVLTSIRNTNLTIHNRLNELKVLLTDVNDTITSIQIGIFTLNTSMNNLINTLKEFSSEMRIKISQLNTTLNGLSSLVLTVKDTLTITIVGNISTIRNLIETLGTNTNKEFSDVKSAISDLSNLAVNINSTLITKLSDLERSISDKLDATAGVLSSKIDTVDRKQSEGFGSLMSNLSLFSLAIILLEVVIVGLIGYSFTRRPVG
ncbi:MAG: hypothetical protein QXP71_00400 [Desulfurococcaceae archaeon]